MTWTRQRGRIKEEYIGHYDERRKLSVDGAEWDMEDAVAFAHEVLARARAEDFNTIVMTREDYDELIRKQT